MKITVFGAGSVGGHMAARLVMSGQAISIVARGAHLAAMQQKGLTLNLEDQLIPCPVNATDCATDLGPQDLVIISVKGNTLPAAIDSIRPLVGPATQILFVMNGLPCWFLQDSKLEADAFRPLLDPSGNIAGLVPLERTIWGVVSSGGMIVEPGVIKSTTPKNNAIKLGYPDNGKNEFIQSVAALLTKAGYKAELSANIKQDIWQKLAINVGLALTAAIIGLDNRATVANPETRAVVIACMRDLAAIGRSIGIEITDNFETAMDPGRVPAHRSSFLQDLDAGRAMELPSSILAVREIGRATGVNAPYLNTIAALIEARSAGR